MKALLVYGHPALATVTLLLAWFVFRAGFHQRIQRLRRVTAPAGSLARHVKLGPISVVLFAASAIGGLGSAVFLRDMKPLATFHGILGLITANVFGALYVLGRQLTSGNKTLVNFHGVLGLLSLFAAGLTGVLGISLLP